MDLRLKGVSKSFGGKPVLEGIDLELSGGRTHVLLGSSGSGKSTLLRILAGLIAPDQGEVRINGDAVSPETQPRLASRIGYVIQDGGLFPHLTARANLSLQPRLVGGADWTPARIEARIQELARLASLDSSLLDRYPGELSGGQRQRVGLMRALMLGPPVLLLDEPLGALDPLVRAGLQRELRQIFRTLRSTVVLVTHDIGEAAFLGDTIALLDQGRIAQHGTLAEMASRPANPFVSEFLRSQRPPDEMAVLE
jgi:osmoprotectant transport system ATP-binding protein